MASQILYQQIDNKGFSSKLPKTYSLLDQFGIAKQSYELSKSQLNFIDSTTSYSTTAQTVHQFQLPSAVVGDFYLELDSLDGTTASASPIWTGFNAINKVEFSSSIGTLTQYFGYNLGQYCIWKNKKYGHDTTDLLKQLNDFGINTGGTTSGNTLCIPIIGPGSNGVLGKPSTPLNLALMQGYLTIKITLNPGNQLSSVALGPVNFSKVRLVYTQYTVEPDQAKLYNIYYGVDLSNSQSTSITLSQNILYNFNCQNTFDVAGQKETCGMLCHLVSNNDQTTTFSQLNGQNMNALAYISQNVYIHRNPQEAKLLSLSWYGVSPLDDSGSCIYLISFKQDILEHQLGPQHGIKMLNTIPTLQITSSVASGTYWLYTTAISKMQYVIGSDGVLRNQY